jgi:hypothetical protein
MSRISLVSAIFLLGMAMAALAAPTQSNLDAAKLAEDRGALIYAYDQAAWHSTDVFMQDIGLSPDRSLRGYVVVPDPDGRLRAIYYATSPRGLVAYRSYSVGSDKSVVRLTQDNGSPLSGMALRMIAARDAALEYAGDNELGFCADARPNTVVLPPDANGHISVYIMTPQIETGYVPVGGHYRFDFNGENQLVSHRKFANSCLSIPPPSEGGAVFVMNHVLDEQPTEIHAFLSRTVAFPIAIIFESRDVWQAIDGHFQFVEELEAETKS